MENKPPFIDIGVNLTHRQLFDDLENVIKQMTSANIIKAVITSSSIQETYDALKIINKYPNLFFTTVGFHPHNAKEFKNTDLELMRD